MIILKTKGIYTGVGEIKLESEKKIYWKNLSDQITPKLLIGTSVELSISFDENSFLSGVGGIVWASFDSRQAEVIQNTLLAQNINNEVKMISFEAKNMFLISITNEKDIKAAIDFIWEGNTGLRLKPDWSYPDGETNKSFEQWLGGHL